MAANRLTHEKSPYLLQHAHNPVDWYPWGPEAFEKARQEDKPIFLSVGYSTCHWCHVMERESFENEGVARVLNESFVPIKVDREERPDVDRIYMLFVQATTGSGGWPMSVWLTPDLKPFFGGTYFPPDNRYGRPGFAAVLKYLAEQWRVERQRIVESSAEVVEQLRRMADAGQDGTARLDDTLLDSAYAQFRRTFDPARGGFGGAPKFPRPVTHNFLFRYAAYAHHPDAAEMVLLTLREMAKGGMNDQLGGGFHRYSVDARWFVPHFEKMLYDQAQLAVSYLEAFQITHDEQYARVARDIFRYVLRDLTGQEGAFYSAEDADSVIDPAQPNVKGEGAFYIWSREELTELLGEPTASYFAVRYGVEEDGNVQEDPHHEFTGRNILYEARTIEETASQFSMPADQMHAVLDEACATLLAARAHRVRPHLDDKILTAWNGLMVSAFAKGAQVIEDATYLAAAERAADFLLSQMWRADEGVLLRRYRAGEAAIPGFLDDYAFFAQALLDLYETSFEPARLQMAVLLAERMLALFEDQEQGGLYSTAPGQEDLVVRMKEDYDGAEPAGNSIAVLTLLRLAHLTGREDFQNAADRALSALAGRMRSTPTGVPQLLAGYLFARNPLKQIVFAGEASAVETKALLRVLHQKFVPNHVVLFLKDEASRTILSRYSPALAEMTPVQGRTAVYVCENFTCQRPVATPEEFAQLLQ